MVLISDEIILGAVVPFTPLGINGMLAFGSRGGLSFFGGAMAYEDVIPDSFLNPGAAGSVLDLLASLPIPGQDRITVFISWSKDVGYNYTREDLDILRSA